MNVQEYEAELRRLLYSLPEQEREEAVAFYRESIADRIDDGLAEEEAVASMAPPAEAARSILAGRVEVQEAQIPKMDEASAEAAESIPGVSELPQQFAQQSTQPPVQQPFWTRLRHGQLTPWEWVGVVLSSIIWLPLLACVFSVALGVALVAICLYLCAWVLIACVWIAGATCVVAAPANILFIIWGAQIGNIPYMLVNIGYSLIAFGGGIWGLRGAWTLTKLFLKGHREVVRAIRKEPAGPVEPEMSVSPSASEKTTTFLRICLILMGVGLASVVAGYLLSGFDWHVFITSFIHDGHIYLGGVMVEHPEHLLFGMLYFGWLV